MTATAVLLDAARDTTPAAPVLQRIPALDIIRGVAIGGILLANVFVFFGIAFMAPDRAAALPTAQLDSIAKYIEFALVQGKFYSIFSLLFGIGFGVQLARGGDAMLPRFRRRLRILLAIGAVHAVFIWYGDILMLYALLGFSMPWFARKTDEQLKRWIIGMLAAPTAVYCIGYLVYLIVAGPSPAANADSNGGGMPPFVLDRLRLFGEGGIVDAFISNQMMLAARWADLFRELRFPKVLGMFVLGLLIVRKGIAVDPAANVGTLRKWALIGWGIGLPANIIAAWATFRSPFIPPTPGSLLAIAAAGVGFPMLAIGYASTVALLAVRGNRLVRTFGPVGRMALTNYLMHSVVCVILSYGFGFGLYWKIGAATAMGIALLIALAQLPLSAWWLSHFRFGPVEWIWRRLTYRQPLRIRA